MWVGPHSLHCYSPSWIQALCAADRREGRCYHTHKHTNMQQHTFTRWGKYFTLTGCSLHDHSSQFSPMMHTDTMKLIDHFTKNQLGAGYVRTLRAKGGKRTVKGGENGGKGGAKRSRDITDEDKMWGMQERQSARGISFWHCSIFFLADTHTAAASLYWVIFLFIFCSVVLFFVLSL